VSVIVRFGKAAIPAGGFSDVFVAGAFVAMGGSGVATK
jgi:hypothetical protein